MANEEFNTLEEYANCIKQCLIHIVHDYQMAKDSIPVITYATAPIAYAKIQEHFSNGSNVGPLITFYQSGIEISKDDQMGGWKILTVQRNEGNYDYRAPIICKIKYTVTINALTEIEADFLQAQIMQATPFHRPYYTKLNGQFVLIQSDDPTNLSSVDVGENKDKVSQRQLSLTIDRAYINYDIKELNSGTIEYSEEDNNPEGLAVIKTLKNGVEVLEDGSYNHAKINKNTSNDGRAPYNYNLIDKNGKTIDVVKKGKIKVIMHSIEGIS